MEAWILMENLYKKNVHMDNEHLSNLYVLGVGVGCLLVVINLSLCCGFDLDSDLGLSNKFPIYLL